MIKVYTILILALIGSITLFKFTNHLVPAITPNMVIAEKNAVGLSNGNSMAMKMPLVMDSQQDILKVAFIQAKQDGHKSPELVQGIILQETGAGSGNYRVSGPTGSQYYGLGQISLVAAKDVMAKWPVLWSKYKFHTKTDDELKAFLILNPMFNIEITSKYLKLLQVRYGLSGRALLNAYNKGPVGATTVDDEWHYAVSIESKLANKK